MQSIIEGSQEKQAQGKPYCGGVDVTRSADLPKSAYNGPRPNTMSRQDRRLVLRGDLRLLARRADAGIAVNARDLERLLPYTDDREAA